MQQYKALTWDHPRGYNALAAASDKARSEGLVDIVWDKQPLEGFESHPIADLCARYDLVVLDHPHVGEAVAQACLQPLEEVFGIDTLEDIGRATIGPCLKSYRYAGSHWALPLDAATQVMATRPDLLEGDAPLTWDAVEDMSASTGKVALSLAGPEGNVRLVGEETGIEVFERMQRLADKSPASVKALNPIGILGHMADNDDVALCPLVYGYVNYSVPASGCRIAFRNAPRATIGGRPGSTLGGTGIGISRRCEVTPELKQHILWLMGEDAQTHFIPNHDGQPSRRSAWHDAGVNGRWGDFYDDTADTLEAAYVRPRFDGYIAFQGKASAFLREAFDQRMPARAAIQALNALYRASLPKIQGEVA